MVSPAIAIGFAKFIMKLNDDEKKAFAFIASVVLRDTGLTPEKQFHMFNELAPIDRNLFLTVSHTVDGGKLHINFEATGLNKLGITPLFAEIIDFMSEDSNTSFIEECFNYVTLIKRGTQDD